MKPLQRASGLRAIALFEAVKGAIALLAWLALVDLLRHDVRALVSDTIAWLGLQPEEHLSEVLLHYADQLPDLPLHSLGLLAVAYAAIRAAEAWGLWHDMLWAEYLGAGSGGIYVPFEVFELIQQPSWWTTGLLAINLFIVAYLVLHLWHEKHDMPAKIDKWRTS